MGWQQRHQQQLANQKYQEEQKQKEAAQKQREAAEQAAALEAKNKQWSEIYNEGGDQALADWMIENGSNAEYRLSRQDLAYANQIKEGTVESFNAAGKAAQDAHHQQWMQMTKGNETYGAQNQTLRELMPYQRMANNYEGLTGWVDPQIQIDKDNAAAEKVKKEADAQNAALAKQERDKQLANSFTENQSSVQDAFGVNGSNNTIGQGPDSNREEAVERAQEYQNNSNNQVMTNTDTSKAINNTEKGTTTKTTTWDNSGYVQGLADDAFKKYQVKWGGGGSNQTTNYSNIFNNVKQNAGNSGDWKTDIGNNNKINSSKIGNNYSLNLGSIDLKNQQS
jgi:hypothetical protein